MMIYIFIAIAVILVNFFIANIVFKLIIEKLKTVKNETFVVDCERKARRFLYDLNVFYAITNILLLIPFIGFSGYDLINDFKMYILFIFISSIVGTIIVPTNILSFYCFKSIINYIINLQNRIVNFILNRCD